MLLLKKSLKSILCLMLLLIGASALAQTDESLSERLKPYLQTEEGLNELMKSYAQHYVASLDECISYIPDKNKDLTTRKYYRDRALKLFLKGGDAFEEDSIQNTGVKIQISNNYWKKPVVLLMKDYFTGLLNLRYPKVDIQSTKIYNIDVSDLQKIDEDKYVCSACWEQIFVGYKDGIAIYENKNT